MIQFNHITIENLGSFVNQSFKFKLNKPGLNIIKGENGSGKTTLINAIVWVLYGKGIKPQASIEPWEWLRDRDYTGTYVKIDFLKGLDKYVVIRCLNCTKKIDGTKGANRLIVFKNEKEIPIKGKLEIQKKLIEYIGMSYDLFVSSIVFGQKMKRLIEESGTKQKEILDEAFETSFIIRAKEKAVSELSGIKSLLDEKKSIISEYMVRLDHLRDELSEMKKIQKNYHKDREKRITLLKSELSGYQKELKRLENNPKLLLSHKLRPKIDGVRKDLLISESSFNREKFESDSKLLTRTKTNKSYLIDEIKSLNDKINNIDDRCPVCKRKFPLVEKEKHIAEIRDEILNKKNSLKALNGVILGYKKKVSSALIARKHIETLINKLKRLEEKISGVPELEKDIEYLKNQIKSKQSQIDSVKKEEIQVNIPKIKTAIKKYETNLVPIIKEEKKLTRKLKVYDWVISDPLSNTGLKVYIFNSMIKSINQHLKYYAKFMGLRSEFRIDLDSYRKGLENYIYISDNMVPYDDLSGGQGQLVNIAIAFAIHDEVTKNIPINILFLDEVFESLSKRNIEVVSDIISDKSSNKPIWLITHRDEFSTINANILEFELHKGLTTIK